MKINYVSSSLALSKGVSIPSSPSKGNQSNLHLKPVAATLQHDFLAIQNMSDVKSDIGKSRAFIRLALERKLLSKHLRTLLTHQDLLVSMYKRYAFLRCEEEREQFLTHLLTLNAVELFCFTNTFCTSALQYTLVLFVSAPITGWFSLQGSLNSLHQLYITQPTTVFKFKNRNLGLLNCLTLSTSQSCKVYLEDCFVRNEITGHTFRFPCNKWFGRNIEDGATERIMIGELMVEGTCIGDVMKKSRHPVRSSSIGRNWTRNSNQEEEEELHMSADELQQRLGEIVNNLVRFYYSHLSSGGGVKLLTSNGSPSRASCSTLSALNSPTNHHQTLLKLLFASKQLLPTLQLIFYHGFKNRARSSFRKQLFLWDYLLRLQMELKLLMNGNQEAKEEEKRFVNLIESISSKAPNWGKDGKLQLFLLATLRDKLWSVFLPLLSSRPSLLAQFYTTSSFLRDASLLTFLLQLLSTFKDIHLFLDPSITNGI